LTRLVRFVEAHNTVSVTWLDERLELADLLGTPQHRAAPETERLGDGGHPRAPGHDSANAPSLEVLESSVVINSPTQPDLAMTIRSRGRRRGVVVRTTGRLGSRGGRGRLSGSRRGLWRFSWLGTTVVVVVVARGGSWTGLATFGVVSAPLLGQCSVSVTAANVDSVDRDCSDGSSAKGSR